MRYHCLVVVEYSCIVVQPGERQNENLRKKKIDTV